MGLRLPEGATDAALERALKDGAILRTHALRWTWQLVTPEDIRWMLALLAPHLTARYATRHRQLELDAVTFRRSNAALEKALRDGAHLTRQELAAVLRRMRISIAGQRLAHLLARAEFDALICSGARRGKQSTYALLDGQVIGTWRRTLGPRGVAIELRLFEPLSRLHPAIRTAASRYAAFLGRKPGAVQLTVR